MPQWKHKLYSKTKTCKVLNAVKGKNQCTSVPPACQAVKSALYLRPSKNIFPEEQKLNKAKFRQIFTSTVRLPDLCIDSLITACSSECTRESNHRNNGTKNHSLDIVYFIGILLWVTCFLQAPLYYSNSKPCRLGEWLQDKICKKALCVHMNYTCADN